MVSQGPRRPLGLNPARLTVAAISVSALSAIAAAPTAVADDQKNSPSVPHSLDGALERLDVKAKPAEPAPEFVTRTRPSPSRLHFIPTAVPHAVSPVPVKTPSEIEAAKDALDAAKVRQLNPVPPPVDLLKRSAKSMPKAGTENIKSGADAD